jgi:hypothetical protein
MTKFADKSFSVHAGVGQQYRDNHDAIFGKKKSVPDDPETTYMAQRRASPDALPPDAEKPCVECGSRWLNADDTCTGCGRMRLGVARVRRTAEAQAAEQWDFIDAVNGKRSASASHHGGTSLWRDAEATILEIGRHVRDECPCHNWDDCLDAIRTLAGRSSASDPGGGEIPCDGCKTLVQALTNEVRRLECAQNAKSPDPVKEPEPPQSTKYGRSRKPT